MVVHQCPNCNQIFTRKSILMDHYRRKTPCDKNKKQKKIKCKYCNKLYARKDSLERHIKTIHASIEIDNKSVNVNKTVNVNNNNNSNIVVGDNNVINQYFILPFGTYQIDDLTTTEKVGIFSSKLNPIEMIIIKTHLDPNKKQYHNCGITDVHSGYGIIHDGEEWKCWRISDIMNILIELNQENTLKIYDKIKHFFQVNAQKLIERDLNNNKNLIFPRNNCYDMDIKSKKNLIAHLKTKFYNHRNIIQDAIKNTGNITPKPNKNDTSSILKEGITIEDIDNYLKNDVSLEKVMKIKQIGYDILSLIEIDNHNKNLIINYVNVTNNLITINNIVKSLSVNCFIDKNITYKSLLDRMKINNDMDNYFDKYIL